MDTPNDTLLPTWRHDGAATPADLPSAPSVADQRVPELAQLYAQADPSRRARLLQILLRPVGPLALVGIAAGAFASLLPVSARWQGARITPEAAAAIGSDAVHELAIYLAQKSPELLAQLLDQLGRG